MPGVWRTICVGLATCLLTGVVAWFSFGAGNVSRAAMEAYVVEKINHERELSAQYVTLLSKVADEFSAFRLEQTQTNVKLETLIGIMQERADGP